MMLNYALCGKVKLTSLARVKIDLEYRLSSGEVLFVQSKEHPNRKKANAKIARNMSNPIFKRVDVSSLLRTVLRPFPDEAVFTTSPFSPFTSNFS